MSTFTLPFLLTEGSARQYAVKVAEEPLDEWLLKWQSRSPYLVEVKKDGERVLVQVRGNGEVRLANRHSSLYTSANLPSDFVEAVESAVKGHEVILDGEFLAGKNLYDFLRARARARANGGDGDDLWLYIFDILYLDGVDLRDKPLAERKRILAETINVNVNGRVRLAEPRLCHVKTEIEEEFRRAVESGEEGVVVKPTGSLYRSGVWLKLKRRQTLDAVIVAAKKSPRFLRDGVPHSFLIGFAPDFKPCSGVGSGLNSEERTAVASLIPILKTREDREHIHLKPFLVVEIAYEDKLKDGGLRSPRILRLRTDKSPEECLSPLSFLLDNIV